MAEAVSGRRSPGLSGVPGCRPGESHESDRHRLGRTTRVDAFSQFDMVFGLPRTRRESRAHGV